jgi:hypothetical protein
MKSAQSFKDYYESSFKKEEDQAMAQKLSDEFFADFIHYTPIKLELLESYISAGQIDNFYNSLADLKYLVEFSDHFNRYWYLLRAYSGALSKLKADQSVKGSKKLYSYYFAKYGDRRILRKEHWFEKKRWEFLDELQTIFSEAELKFFMLKYQRSLAENFKIYESYVMVFITDLKKIQKTSEVVKKINIT